MADRWWQELESLEAALASGDVDAASSGLRRFDDDPDWWRRGKDLRARAEALKLRLLLPKVAELEQAVVRHDAVAAEALVRRIHAHTIHSGNEVYSRLEALQPGLLWLLFERLGAEGLHALIGQVRGLYSGSVWTVMEAQAEQIRAEELLAWCRLEGFPSESWLPRLHARLAALPDKHLAETLIAKIDGLCSGEAEHGEDLTAHQATQANFQHLRWQPDDAGLAEAVGLLAARREPAARAACLRYLLELPWGEDRRATPALANALGRHQPDLLRQGLCLHRQPGQLRCWLWAGLAESDPQAALLGLVDDLARVSPSGDALMVCATTLAVILAELGNPGGRGADLGPVRSAVERLNTRRWPRSARGVFGVNLAMHLPDVRVDRVSSRLDRALVLLADWYECRVRIEHMAPFGKVLLMVAVGVVGRALLDASLGHPAAGAPASAMFYSLWVLFALVTQHTHVSAEPTVGGSLTALAIYVTLPVCALVTGIAERLL